MMRSRRFHILILAGGMGLAACSRTQTADLNRMVPGLSAEMVRHLTKDRPTAFKNFARNTGLQETSTSYIKVFLAPRTDSLSYFVQDEAQLSPYLKILVQALSEEFHLVAVQNRTRAYLRQSPANRREIVCLIRDIRTLVYNDTIPIQEKAGAYRQLINRTLPFSGAFNLADMYATYASYLPGLNQVDSMAYYYEKGVQAAIAVGDLDTASQLLGTLGTVYGGSGNAVEMRKMWDRGIELARKVNSPQECRILSFQAGAYMHDGRFGLSRDFANRAQDRCRELGAKNLEIRFLVESLYLFWALDCWPVLEKDLQRADALLREGEGDWSPAEKKHWVTQVNRFKSLYLAGIGSCAEAESLSALIMRDLAGNATPRNVIPARMDVATSLRYCGKLDQALSIAEENLAMCRKEPIKAILPGLDLELAEIQLARGSYPEAHRALQLFEVDEGTASHDSPGRGWSRHDALSVQLDMKTGNLRSARQHVITALFHLQKQWRGMDMSPEAAMALPVAAKLGDLAHDLLDTSPEMGYARELDWLMHQAGVSDTYFPPSDAALLRMAREALKRLDREHAMHCVYRVENDRVLRWTAYKGKVVQDDLPITLLDLQSRVSLLRRSVLNPSSQGDTLARQGHELTTLLLPSFMLAQNGPRHVFVTPDGPLRQLPFEILNVTPSSYEPLLDRVDLAYVLYDRPWKKESPGSVLTVCDPAYSPELKRQYSILTEGLPAGMHEAFTFGGSFSNVTSLRGAEATKANLLKSWGKAEALYFACHSVQDPEIPYITFIPLASSSTGQKEDAYLDLVDVRGADLSGCRLVVLSNCGTGASYLSRRVSAPSLAEAFLQAGARAVIGTSWSVRDDEAARVMHSFANEFAASGKDAVSALNIARRELFEEGAPPRVWAAYSVMLGGF